MGFANNSYAKVWKKGAISPDGTRQSAQISTSRKDKNGEYITDFSAYVNFYGNAFRVLESISEKDSIQIEKCSVQNKYDAQKKTTTVYYSIFECRDANQRKNEDNSDLIETGEGDEDLPF